MTTSSAGPPLQEGCFNIREGLMSCGRLESSGTASVGYDLGRYVGFGDPMHPAAQSALPVWPAPQRHTNADKTGNSEGNGTFRVDESAVRVASQYRPKTTLLSFPDSTDPERGFGRAYETLF